MHKTLILTGWSKTVYMPAAAAALEALKWKADVAGVSMDVLAGELKDRAPNYKTVFVLGVGLKKNIGQTISTLMELKTKGVRTVWLSSMPVAPEFAAEVCLEGVDPAVLRRFTFKVEFDVLDTVGKQKFFERTFGTQLTAGERTRLHEIENVTPGDFRTVRQRLFYHGGEVDNEMRIRAIEQECANKRASHRGRIGF